MNPGIKYYYVYIFIAVISNLCCSAIKLPSSKVSNEKQEVAVNELIKRLLGLENSQLFDIEIKNATENEADIVKICTINKTVVKISGANAVSVAYGFHYYLKNYCKCHISWDFDQLKLPKDLPYANDTIVSYSLLRYYQNVCTSSYSFVWWNWTRWEREIDWMALNGINIALAFTGQEVIWKRVYKRFNLTDEEINEYFTGPAFLAWNRMGNIRKWGGPLSNQWNLKSLELQHRILNRMRELSIIPILPCFAGYVPRAFQRIFPNSSMVPLARWAHFPDEYSGTFLLDPTDKLFQKVGQVFMEELTSEFGTNHLYQCDTFNEMNPHRTEDSYLHNVSKAVFDTMNNTDPLAIWILQGWLFVDQVLFWTKERVHSLLSGVPDDRLIILDLQSELFPQYTRLESYFGKPFIWCMLHNFGGTLGMHGSSDIINDRIMEARNIPNSTMIGIGLTPEGIYQNYVIYDLMLEMAWHNESLDLNRWFAEYSARRYGTNSNNLEIAWNHLRKSVYNYKELITLHGQYTVCVRPKLNLDPWVWYDVNDILISWDLFIKDTSNTNIRNNSNFRYDLIDVSRQVLQLIFDTVYKDTVKAYFNHNMTAFQISSQLLLSTLLDLESLLATNEKFLLGIWLSDAKSFNLFEEQNNYLYEENARNLITLWGPNGEIVDYATKQWSGIVKDYYYPRWKLFVTYLNESLTKGIVFNYTRFKADVFHLVEQPFTYSKTVYPTYSQGDTIKVAIQIYRKWRIKNTQDALVQTFSIQPTNQYDVYHTIF